MRHKQYTLFSLCLIILLNPILATFFFDTEYQFQHLFSLPDTFAYIAQAENLYRNFQLHTGPWGHVDKSIILPPIYPSLIALLMFFGMDGMKSAILVSQLAGISFSIFSYIYIQSITNRIIAVISVISIQLTFVYFNFASLALTESLFLALLAGTLLLIKKAVILFDELKIFNFTALGMACSLVFLTRELGIVLLLLAFILFLVTSYRKYSRLHGCCVKNLAFILAGFILVAMPYYVTKVIQTGADPLARDFRLNNYIVEINNRDIINEINNLKKSPTDNYLDIYKKRRELISLLPDSSEILTYTVYKTDTDDNHFILNKIKKVLSHPGNYYKNLIKNISVLKSNIGNFLFVLLACLCATSLLYITPACARNIRVIIPLFIVLYLLLLSVFTSYVSRYVIVILPVALIHICIELYVITYSVCLLKKNINKNIITLLLAFLLPVIVLAGTPVLFYEKQIYPRVLDMESKLKEMVEVVKGEPVFTLFPALAYSVKGNYRQLPNDNLEKVAQYASKTGVQWLLLVDIPQQQEVIKYWTKAYQWMSIKKLDEKYPDIVTYCCGLSDINSKTRWRLYQFNSLY